MSADPREPTGMEVAVVGLTCRFPGAADAESFWRNLRDGVESVRFFSREELESLGFAVALFDHPHFVPAAAVLEDAYSFDAGLFGYSPREAEMLDPQHRIFLECAWEALERAACDPFSYPGSIGVFAGSSRGSYLETLLRNADVRRQANLFQMVISTDKDYLATRVAYKLDLRGPAISVQTACSTSLVAVHLAVQSLLAGDCDVALAGGASVERLQAGGHVYQEGAIASRDGHCRPFDHRATGIVRGQGAGVVVLKRLADALADGDPIQAVIRGSAVNNDGARKVGFTAPRVEGQAQVIRAAQTMAEVAPGEIGYVEAHGTATPLGDPIEIEALTRAFQAGTRETGFCAIGSVKSNFGHLDAAAGVAGLIKTVLSLEHGAIPPSLGFERPNPKIGLERTPFFVNTALRDWERGEQPRVAAVSSFGIGGTNAHVIVAEAPARSPSGPSRPWQLLPLSARTPTALDAMSARLAARLRERPELDLADAAYTLARGRHAFGLRRTVVARDRDEAAALLEAGAGLGASRAEDGGREVVFMFPGQGAQYPNMTRGLYEAEPVFRESVDRCSAALEPHLGLDLREVLYPRQDDAGAAERLRRTSLAQPALFTVELSLASLWRSWGVEPVAAIGHSIGEYVAACLSGVLSLDAALEVVAARGRIMEAMPAGSMIAVPRSEEDLEPRLGAELSLAAVNAPGLCVVAGPTAQVEMLAGQLAREGCECTRLHTSHAFHSSMMDPAVEALREVMARVELGAPGMPYLSNVTGDWITAEQARDPGYWATHLRRTVRFGDGVQRLLESGDRVLVEVGPGQALSGLVQLHETAGELRPVASLRHPRDEQPDLPHLLRALGQLWSVGVRVDWSAFFAGQRRRRERLPTYPFERQRYLVEAGAARARRQPGRGKRADLADWFYIPSWRRTLSPQGPEALGGTWLILDDGSPLGGALERRLRAAGADAVSARRGSEFGGTAESGFTVAPGDPRSLAALAEALEAGGRRPTVILHLWGRGGDGEPSLEKTLDACFWSPIHLARALGETGGAAPVRFVAVAEGALAVSSADALRPERATLVGPCRVIAQEYPNVSSKLVDVPPVEEGAALIRLAEDLLAEALAESGEALVAYRGPERWVPALEPAPLAAPAEGDRGDLREEGTYLITGGLGGVGLALADFLAGAVRARLVLLSRSGLPPRDRWDESLARQPDDGVARRIRAVRALEAKGAQVMLLQVDVADEAGMRAALDSVRSRFGRIAGVVHAAGNPGGGVIQFRARESAERVLRPKVEGTRVLARVVEQDRPDFLVLCSSLTSLVGGVGQVDYCAANAFLDAFAREHAARTGIHTVSIDWDTWSEAGMAVETPLPVHLAGRREELLRHGMTSAEGVEVFRRLRCRRTPSHVAISTRDPAALRAARREAAQGPRAEGKAQAPALRTYPRPPLPTPFVAPADEVEQRLCALWQKSLGVEPIGAEDSFFELGGHSLLALHVVTRINKEFGTELTAARLYEGLTVRFLAGLIRGDGAARDEPRDDTDTSSRQRRADRSRQQRAVQQSRLVSRSRASRT